MPGLLHTSIDAHHRHHHHHPHQEQPLVREVCVDLRPLLGSRRAKKRDSQASSINNGMKARHGVDKKGPNGHRQSLEDHTTEAINVVALLKDCAKQKDLLRGSSLHSTIAKSGYLEKNVFVGNTLINMYAKCGALDKAQEVFNQLPSRNLVSWNVLIGGYAQHDHNEEVFSCYEQMLLDGFSPDAVTFTCILKACGNLGEVDKGRDIHDQILKKRLLEKNMVLGNALVDMYARCGALETAHKVFNELPLRDVATWNGLIAGYVQHGRGEDALHCFDQMQLADLSPDPVTLVCVLKACGSIIALDKGKEIHSSIRTKHLKSNKVLANALLDMYAKCGDLDEAQAVFDDHPNRDIISWNALLGGYAQHARGEEAIACFEQMQQAGFFPNVITYIHTLKACGSTGALGKGQELHVEMSRAGFLSKDVQVGTALLDMYAKCGTLEKAQEVFDELPLRNIVSWNALITGYAQEGLFEEVLRYCECMQLGGFSPDVITFAYNLKASGRLGAVNKGQEVHAQIVQYGSLERETLVGTALVDFYANCGMLYEAQDVFDKLVAQNVVSWSALMEGYAQVGEDEPVFNLLQRMLNEGTAPNSVTFMVILGSFSHGGLLLEGQHFFEIISKGFNTTPTIEQHACMIDLFGRAGQLDQAVALIREMLFSARSLTLWHTLLRACGELGNMKLGRWAFECAAELGEKGAGVFICMNNIYAAASGSQVDLEKIELLNQLPVYDWWNEARGE